MVHPVTDKYQPKNVIRIKPEERSKRPDEVREEQELLITGEKEKVTEEALLQSWAKLLTELNQSGDKNLEGLLKSTVVKLNDDGKTISCKLKHSASEQKLNVHRSEIINILRKELHNDELVLETSIQTDTESKKTKKIYTNKDKFEKLAEKNKNLLDLKDNLGLDFDF